MHVEGGNGEHQEHTLDPGMLAAARAELFFSRYLRHVKGEWAFQPIQLADWQLQRIIYPLFGTLLPDGARQYRTCYAEVPRKSGKSTIAAGIGLKLLCSDGEPGAEIYSAAADKDQANIVFGLAKAMVEKSPRLSRHCKIYKSTIVVPSTDSFYRVLSAEAYTKHGLNAHGIIFDELHAQPSRDLWDVLTTSTGSRRQPLTLAITTAGTDQHSICWEQHDYGIKVLQGIVEDPTFLPIIFAAEKDDDWQDPAIWAKANPALGISLKPEYIAAQCRRAQEIPGYENTFRRLHLNQWTEQAVRWLPMGLWDDGAAPEIDSAAFAGRECYGGLDLASVSDLAALVLVFVDPDGVTWLLPRFWIPEEGARKRAERDKVPYDVWIRQGHIKATSGNVTDYDVIRNDINEFGKQFNIAELGYDRWNASQLVTQLAGDGFTMVPVGQGFASLTAPSKALEKLILAGKVRHGGHPVMRWCASNVAAETDAADNVKPSRKKSTEKIDGIVATVIALSRAIVHQDAHESVYSSRGLITVG